MSCFSQESNLAGIYVVLVTTAPFCVALFSVFNASCKKSISSGLIFSLLNVDAFSISSTNDSRTSEGFRYSIGFTVWNGKRGWKRKAAVFITAWAFPILTYNTRHKSLKQTPFLSNFLEKSWDFYFTLFSPPKCAFSLPNVEPRVFWSTETTVIPKSTLGRGNRHKCFKIFDEYCSLSLLRWKFTDIYRWQMKQVSLTFAPSHISPWQVCRESNAMLNYTKL